MISNSICHDEISLKCAEDIKMLKRRRYQRGHINFLELERLWLLYSFERKKTELSLAHRVLNYFNVIVPNFQFQDIDAHEIARRNKCT